MSPDELERKIRQDFAKAWAEHLDREIMREVEGENAYERMLRQYRESEEVAARVAAKLIVEEAMALVADVDRNGHPIRVRDFVKVADLGAPTRYFLGQVTGMAREVVKGKGLRTTFEVAVGMRRTPAFVTGGQITHEMRVVTCERWSAGIEFMHPETVKAAEAAFGVWWRPRQ